jgi:hypothetical protein
MSFRRGIASAKRAAPRHPRLEVVVTGVLSASLLSPLTASAATVEESVGRVVRSAGSVVESAVDAPLPPPPVPAPVPSAPAPTLPNVPPSPASPGPTSGSKGSPVVPEPPPSPAPDSSPVKDVTSTAAGAAEEAPIAAPEQVERALDLAPPPRRSPSVDGESRSESQAHRRFDGSPVVRAATLRLRRWLAHVWPAVAFPPGAVQIFKEGRAGDGLAASGLLDVPGSLLARGVAVATGDGSPATAPPRARPAASRELLSAPTLVRFSELLAILIAVSGIAFLTMATPWFRGAH